MTVLVTLKSFLLVTIVIIILYSWVLEPDFSWQGHKNYSVLIFSSTLCIFSVYFRFFNFFLIFIYLHFCTVLVNVLLPITHVALMFLSQAILCIKRKLCRAVCQQGCGVLSSRCLHKQNNFVLPRRSEQTSSPRLLCLCLGEEERSLRSASSRPPPPRLPVPAVSTMYTGPPGKPL